jgi:hypothetical protein
MLPLVLFAIFAGVPLFMDDGNTAPEDAIDGDIDGEDTDLETGDGDLLDPTDDDQPDGDPVEDGDPVDQDPPSDDPTQEDPSDDDPVDDTLADVTITTDPQTGALTVTGAEDDTGSLALIKLGNDSLAGSTCCSVDYDYSAALFYVPEGVDVSTVANDFDFNAFFENAAPGQLPTLNDIFGPSGMEQVAGFDLGEYAFLDSAQGEGGATTLDVTDTRVDLPNVESNLPIAYFYSEDYGPFEPGGRDVVEFDRDVELYLSFEGLTEEEVFGSDAPPSSISIDPQDGDTIDGGELSYLILNTPGDPTAVTIEGGAGEDTITGGLNDTIITDDDTDADTIEIGVLPSFAESFDAAPVIEAGSEDTVVVDGTNNFAIRFEVDQANGETEVFYHLVNAPDGLASPAPMLSDQSEPLSIQQFYAEMGWELMATGNLGSYSEAPGGAVIDNTLAPPQFEGIDQGFFSVALPVGGLVSDGSAEFETGWSPIA